MDHTLTRRQVEQMLTRLDALTSKESCLYCDCLQGYLVQLELDASEDVADLTNPRKVSHEQMHSCLGCEPCPPGALHAEYLRGPKPACGCCGDTPSNQEG